MAVSHHLVYFSATDASNREHGTWIAAVADAAAGATYIAAQANIDRAVASFGPGALMVSAGAVSIPAAARVATDPGENWYYDPDNAQLQSDRLRPFPLRTAVRAYHEIARRVAEHIVSFTGLFPPEIINAALSAESWSHRWVHVIALKRVTPVSGGQTPRAQTAEKQALTNARLVATMEQMALGPLEFVGTDERDKTHALLRAADAFVNGGGVLRPLVGPFGWVDPRNDPPNRVGLLQARDLSDLEGYQPPGPVQRINGLDTRVIDIDPAADFATGNWIEGINT